MLAAYDLAGMRALLTAQGIADRCRTARGWRRGSEQARHALADEEADGGDAHADDEHVEAGAEDAAAGEDGARRADEEVGEHGDGEGDGDGGRPVGEEEGEDGDDGADGGGGAGGPAFAEGEVDGSPILSSSRTCSSSMRRGSAMISVARRSASALGIPLSS